MIAIKNERELILMRQACKITAAARALAGEMVRPGVTTKEIDKAVHDYIVAQGAKPSFLHYSGYPASACISVNQTVIHGIPGEYTLKEGDIVSVDVGAYYKGFHGDCAATFACGAISGFHATQSPMMARCLKSEKYGRIAFYGAMITEGFVALIWAAAAIKFCNNNYDQLASYPNPANVVSFICNTWMGKVGAVLAILGVVAAPITSGDTAFRSARLITADFLHFPQDKVWKRLSVSLPLFAISAVLMLVDFAVLWRYFGWFNQTLSIFTLWAITVYLYRNGKCFYITLIPAIFMTSVCSTYILMAPEGFALSATVGYSIGLAFTVLLSAVTILYMRKRKGQTDL